MILSQTFCGVFGYSCEAFGLGVGRTVYMVYHRGHLVAHDLRDLAQTSLLFGLPLVFSAVASGFGLLRHEPQ